MERVEAFPKERYIPVGPDIEIGNGEGQRPSTPSQRDEGFPVGGDRQSAKRFLEGLAHLT
jgi:hypothetical protein